jgi:beta-xylosidase
MKPIHVVAIDALNKFKDKTRSEDWRKNEGYNLYKSWVELRNHQDNKICDPARWYQAIERHIDEAIQTYGNPIARKNMILRSYWVNSFNLHLAIHVMGGYKDCRMWDTYINIMVTN